MIRTLWTYRRVILGSVGGVLAVVSLVVLVALLRSPAEHLASLQFRLVFDGVDQGRYPNGMSFSVSDVVSTPVLAHVYDANDLDRYFSFEDFKTSVFILQSNPEIDMLSLEYQAKLADTRLTSVDRERIDGEFRSKLSSLGISQYSLNLIRHERLAAMPQALISKILADILYTWATQTDELKGGLKYRIPVYSNNIIKREFIEAEDYIIAVDILRSKIQRILANIDVLLGLPGAATARTGPERVSLAEIRANLEDVNRFKIQPLVGLIRSTGLSKDPELAVVYLENQLFLNRLDTREAAGRAGALQQSLRQYLQERSVVAALGQAPGGTQPDAQRTPLTDPTMPALIPQFGESFLDRLVQMSTQNNDVRFRQDITERVIAEDVKAVSLEKETAYYEDLIAAMRGVLRRGTPIDRSAVAERAVEAVMRRSEEALADMVASLDHVNAIYEQISAHNLNSNSFLFAITAPVTTRVQRAVSARTLGLYAILVLMVSLMLVPLACLIHHYFRTEVLGSEPRTAAMAGQAVTHDPVEQAPALLKSNVSS